MVAEVLAGRDDVDGAAGLEPAARWPTRDAATFLQLWPHRHGTDAMFASCAG